jgi:deoxyribose-phosphate aldolase
MDLKEVKRLYGDKLFIAGGIDVSQLLSNGTIEEVKRVCKDAIEAGYPGYFIGSTTELDNGAKLENVLAMLEIVWENKFIKRE